MKRYRITAARKGRDEALIFEVSTKTLTEAYRKAYDELPERLKTRMDVNAVEIPAKPANWEIKYEYVNTENGKAYVDYLVIHADSKQQARNYYNEHYKGKRYRFSPGRIEPGGKRAYGKILKSYIVACPEFHADAANE